MHDGPHSPPSRRGQGSSEYSWWNTPSERRSSERPADRPAPNNWAIRWMAPDRKSEPRLSPASPSPTYHDNRSTADSRAAAAKHQTPSKRRALPPLPVMRVTATLPTRHTPLADSSGAALELVENSEVKCELADQQLRVGVAKRSLPSLPPRYRPSDRATSSPPTSPSSLALGPPKPEIHEVLSPLPIHQAHLRRTPQYG